MWRKLGMLILISYDLILDLSLIIFRKHKTPKKVEGEQVFSGLAKKVTISKKSTFFVRT